MQGRERVLHVDVADYTYKPVCNLYDNNSDISGQAADVFINYERNGWKELSFTIPSVCFNENGTEEDNYRLDYIIADYYLKAITVDGPDWFIASETGVNHEAFSKKTTVTAPHISQRLKNRSLDLELSDDEGNNVGTADQFLKLILEGTDWEPGRVAKFYEDDGETIKVRSLTAAKKTGAFKLIESVCELFEAKPVFYVDENMQKKVDILPMNPFSKLKEGEIPDAVLPDFSEDEYIVKPNVIELHYDKSIKKLERKINAENICTRMYAYGSYGDNVSKYCSVQTAKHEEHNYGIESDFEGEFKVDDGKGAVRYFTAAVNAGDQLVWNMLDFTSQKYVWNKTKEIAYELYLEPKTMDFVSLEGETVSLQNYVPFLSDYSYYRKVGLLTDEMFQGVAAYQQKIVQLYKDIIDAQQIVSELSGQLNEKIGAPYSGYLRLDIEECTQQSDGTHIKIKWSDKYPDGVIWRSDYLEKYIHYFGWHVAEKLKPNGDPISGVASRILVVKDGDPVAWEMAYLKDIDGRTYQDSDGYVHPAEYSYATSEGDRPHNLIVWGNLNIEPEDKVFLFCVDGISGLLGEKLSTDEGILHALENNTRYNSIDRPTIFVEANDPDPEITFTDYGWLYRFSIDDYDNPGTLSFCWVANGDTGWQNVEFKNQDPTDEAGPYLFNTRMRTLWHRYEDTWAKLDSVAGKEAAKNFSVVENFCKKRDEVYKGIYEKYFIEPETLLPAGNYAFVTNFDHYWLFTTQEDAPAGYRVELQNDNNIYIYDHNNIDQTYSKEDFVSAYSYPISSLTFPAENDLKESLFSEGSIYINEGTKSGTEFDTDRLYRSNFIAVWPNEEYECSLPSGSFVVLYDDDRNYLGYRNNLEGYFSTEVSTEYDDAIDPEHIAGFKQVRYIKVVVPAAYAETVITDCYVRLNNWDHVCFANDKKYTIFKAQHEEDAVPVGLFSLFGRFADISDRLYTEAIPNLKTAQQLVTDENAAQARLLGDILREGWWQDNSYVSGDEQRMYNDAMDNLEKVSQPEITYTVDYLDLFGTEEGFEPSEYGRIDWPNIQITDAAHLVDPELGINQWAYFDRINKCYDQPWKTTIEINTQLTLMSQHEFKDVMTRIAEVSSETKSKQTIYQRASAISAEGTIDGSNIEGEINTQEVKVTGGASGWKTDSKGNMVMESSDGRAAMKFSGEGLSISNGKNSSGEWQWEVLSNGYGIRADTVRQGTMSGNIITDGTITANKLMASVGNQLEIGSNKALALYATLDGQRPAGGLKTTDSVIEIKAGYEDDLHEFERNHEYAFGDAVTYIGKKYKCVIPHTSGDSLEESKWQEYNGISPAIINIGSGGAINLIAANDEETEDPSINLVSGGSINAIAGGEINILAGSRLGVAAGTVEIASGGQLNIAASGENSSALNVYSGGEINIQGGSMDISLGGTLRLGSDNIKLDEEGNLTIKGNCTVGGWHIGKEHLGTSTNIADSSVGLRVPDYDEETNEVVFWAGDTDASKAPFRVYANGKVAAKDIAIAAAVDQDNIQTTLQSANIISSSISSSAISSSTISETEISDSSISNTEIKNGNINIGEIIRSNQIIGYNFSVDDTGKVDANEIDILNGTVSGLLTGSFSGALTGSVIGTVYADMGSRFGQHLYVGGDNVIYADGSIHLNPDNSSEYMAWIGNNVNSTTSYLRHNGDAKFARLAVTNGLTVSDVSDSIFLGNVRVDGTFTNPSSKDVKDNIKSLEQKDAFDKLEPVTFNYKNNSDIHYGLIYEDVIKLYPEVCHEDSDGNKGISYIDLIAVLIKEVQTLKHRVTELERKWQL